jgi:putative membrane protein
MAFTNMSPALVLLGSYTVLWSAMAVSPADWHNWILSSVIPVLVVTGLTASRQFFPLSMASYLLVGAFIALHTVGAHYTYARVPLGDWLSPVLGGGRNDYDRIVHFAFGLLLATPLREAFARLADARGPLLHYLTVMTIVGLSSLWEILESWVARIVNPELGAAYLGAQGDVWDAQKDMAAALYGALIWLALSLWARRRHRRAGTEEVATSP